MLAALAPCPIAYGSFSSGCVRKSHAKWGDVADISLDSSEMSYLVCWEWSELWWPCLYWAAQLAVCARALCAFRECSPPPPPPLTGFVPSGALGLEMGLFPLLVWLACLRARSGAKGAWPSAPQAPLASPLFPLDCDVEVLHKALGLLVSQTWLRVDKEMMFLRWSLCSPEATSLLTAERENTTYVTCFIRNGYSQVRWIPTSASLVHDFKGQDSPEQREICMISLFRMSLAGRLLSSLLYWPAQQSERRGRGSTKLTWEVLQIFVAVWSSPAPTQAPFSWRG